MNLPSLLEGRPHYARTAEGWADCARAGDALVHTVRVGDPGREIEVTAEVVPSPSYAVRAIAARALRGQLDPRAADGLGDLAGTALVAGLGRRARQAMGGGAGTDLLFDGIIEVARFARQVACLPRDRVERAAADGPAGFWRLDREGWVDLPDSCFTYSDAGAARLGEAGVAVAATPELYSPRPGQQRIFARRRTYRLEHAEGRLTLAGAMHDNVHGFDVTFELDLESGRIARVDSAVSRLPYAGICSVPQERIRALLGEVFDAGLSRRVQALVGGAAGCAQLFDLTSDLLRLAAAPRVY